MPLQQFVQHLYFKPFGKQRLAVVLTIDVVVTIEEKVRPDSPSTMEIWHKKCRGFALYIVTGDYGVL
jgi:hypothetical protein